LNRGRIRIDGKVDADNLRLVWSAWDDDFAANRHEHQDCGRRGDLIKQCGGTAMGCACSASGWNAAISSGGRPNKPRCRMLQGSTGEGRSERVRPQWRYKHFLQKMSRNIPTSDNRV
jgi:hypothetical protein